MLERSKGVPGIRCCVPWFCITGSAGAAQEQLLETCRQAREGKLSAIPL